MEESKLIKKSKREEKGFGMKMLEKFGWDKGSGLGKNGQGIVDPIEVNVRPKNMGLGFNKYRPKEAALSVMQESTLEDEPTCSIERKEKLWLEQDGRSRKRKKEYVTEEELVVAKKQERGLNVVEKVLDMRGPQVRVLTSLKNLNANEENLNDTPMPELRRNLRKNVDLAELDVQKRDWDLRYEKQTVIDLREEKQKLRDDVARQKEEVDRLDQIVTELDRLENEGHLGLLTLESLAYSFGELQKVFLEEYKLFSLSKVACFFAYPLFHKLFQGWDPLVKPTDHLSIVSIWKDLLNVDHEIFDSLLMEVVVPALRMSITNTWQAKHPEPLLRFLDSWQEVLPYSALETLLDHIVMPKLSAAVDSWDPRQDKIPVHVWVHPWLPFLDQKLEAFLYPTIQYKLEHCVLKAWLPSDTSAYTILSPWKSVFV